MKIKIDNIIFSLQKAGGISLVWKEFIQRLVKEDIFDLNFLEYENAKNNFFRNQLVIDKKIIKSNKSFLCFIVRFFDLKLTSTERFIFHSSYYRLTSNKNAINITTVHDFTYEYFFKGISKKLHVWQKKRAIFKSDGIICISENTKKDLLHFYPQVDCNKIRVIYNGVDENYKLLNSKVNFNKTHFFKDFEYAIFVGDHSSNYKNFELAVRACYLSNMKLLIIGGGILAKKQIHLLINLLGKNNFKSLTKVSVEDLNQYYNRAYCLLYPSIYEGFGIPIVEAQKAGCPVIATNCSSIPEVIGNLFFAINKPTPEKIANKMKFLKLGSELRKSTIELGIQKAALFSWDKTYNETINFYKELYYK